MGTYLSSPIVEKGMESGECLDDQVSPLAWGMVDMQGWRKSMEDSHVADTNVDIPPHLRMDSGHDDSSGKVFAVFDGHGGSEVARFCQLYLVDVISKQQTWKEESPNDEEDSRDPAATPVGQALIHAFHALDRMIDSRSRRDELIRLRTDKPQPGERRSSDSNPIPPLKYAQRFEPVKVVDTKKEDATATEADEEEPKVEIPEANYTPEKVEEEVQEEASGDSEATKFSTDNGTSGETAASTEAEEDTNAASAEEKTDESSEEDSTAVVGKDGPTELDADIDLDNGTNGEEDDDQQLPSNAAFMFADLIGSLEGDTGQVMAKFSSSSEAKSPECTNSVTETAPATLKTAEPTAPTPGIVATIIQNGRQICNLPDHPIHAGCTATVAVLIGRTLTIANAGDSRAVLCRVGGRAEALSFDHKPHQDREMSRITKAGGFVNQFGRVNGNLNLSRSIGDLKYKQIPGLTPAEQMITAEPDIIQVTLHPKDEFVVLGCDGIWDCLSNDQAVKYVRDRIDSKSPTEIGIEMLDEIISEDPRATQGIGGDNMTIMVVDLQPSKRVYR